MRKFLVVIIISIISQVVSLNVFAGSDGTLKMKNKTETSSEEVKDCFETLNRGIFAFNQGLDKVVFKPIAKGYRYLPKPIRSGTSNALSNLSNVVTIPNNLLQGQFKDAGINTLRFSINSTLGIAGIFDATPYYGLNKLDKEIINSWNLGRERRPLFCSTCFGPNNGKRYFGFNCKFRSDAWYNVSIANDTRYLENSDYYSRLAAGIDFRAKNLEAFDSLENNSIDLYASVRSLYLQDRKRKILNLDETTETMNDDDWEEIDTQ